MAKEKEIPETILIPNPEQEGAAEAADEKKEMSSSIKEGTQQDELEADKTRLAQLKAKLEQEPNPASPVSKAREREYDALKRKIERLEESNAKRSMEAAMARVGEKMEYQLRDGSVISKKASYIKNNRMINPVRVDEFIRLIKRGDYEPAYPIIVSNAEKFKKNNPSISIVDAFGNEIPETELDEYVVYLDGQHRGRALIICKLLNLYQEPIQGVVVKEGIKDVAKFLISINPAGSWSNNQKAEVLALTTTPKYQPLCEAISRLVRTGYNRSTSSQIMTQSKPLSTRQIDLLLSGQEPKDEIVYNVENGNAFIEACSNAGIEVKYLTKRYFIEGFSSFKNQYDLTFTDAIEVVKKMPKLDETTLKSVKGKDVFKQILEEEFQKKSK